MIRSKMMSIEWAGLSPELLLRLDRRLPEPLGYQLQHELREAIRSSRLRPDERLPLSRVLARQLGISRGLVLDCYTQLEAEGFLVTRGGSATRVAAGAHVSPSGPARVMPQVRLAADFRPGVPDLAGFPRRDWLWALGEASQAMANASLDYGNPLGSAELRTILAAYLRRVRGAVVDPDQLVICAGFAQGLNLVLRTLAAGGVRQVAFEDPGYRDQRSSAEHAGVEGVPVPIDERGIDVLALAATGVGAVVLTPAHQSPTGVVLAPERRHALVAWARERDAAIVEDDYDAEFRYDRQPVGALQGLAPDRVITIGTVSKSLAPAVRLGWIVGPPWLTEAVAREKDLDDRGSPGLDQVALARLIESGRYDRHLRRMRAVYAGRRGVLVEALTRHAPNVELRGLAAGFHGVVRLPDDADEATVVAAARARSVGIYGMSAFRANGAARPPELVLGFGNVTESAIERGIAAIGDLLRARR
jgi:GntR family transcriptional regulator / MocR family aminotransferase